jgi:hypothetical protein
MDLKLDLDKLNLHDAAYYEDVYKRWEKGRKMPENLKKSGLSFRRATYDRGELYGILCANYVERFGNGFFCMNGPDELEPDTVKLIHLLYDCLLNNVTWDYYHPEWHAHLLDPGF